MLLHRYDVRSVAINKMAARNLEYAEHYTREKSGADIPNKMKKKSEATKKGWLGSAVYVEEKSNATIPNYDEKDNDDEIKPVKPMMMKLNQ